MESLTDFEQKEMLKKWWQDYGKYIAIAIIVGIIFGFGWRHWQERRVEKAAEASTVYQQLLAAEQQKNIDQVRQLSDRIRQDYPKTNYAALAALFEAKDAAEKQDLATAYQKLNWILSNSRWAAIKQIARIRAVSVLLEQGKTDEAMQILSVVDDKSFQALIDQAQGDILTKQGKTDQAQQAYQKAKAGMAEFGIINPVLEMKLSQ